MFFSDREIMETDNGISLEFNQSFYYQAGVRNSFDRKYPGQLIAELVYLFLLPKHIN